MNGTDDTMVARPTGWYTPKRRVLYDVMECLGMESEEEGEAFIRDVIGRY